MVRNSTLGSVLAISSLLLVASTAVAAAPARDLQCSGVVTAVTVRNVVVPPGGTCVLRDSQVTGSVTAGAAAYLQTIHSRIAGHVVARNSETLFIEGGSRVRGTVRASGVAGVFV